MHVKITYPVDRQYMPYLPRVWRMDTEGVKIHTSFSPFMIGHMFWGTKGEFQTRSKTDLSPTKKYKIAFFPSFIVRRRPLGVKAYVILI